MRWHSGIMSRFLLVACIAAAFPAAAGGAYPAGGARGVEVPSLPDTITAVETARDSSLALRYGLLYENRIDLERSSVAFPWNDPAEESHLSDRLSLMISIGLPLRADIFVKGATGARATDRLSYSELFVLEQGHLSFAHPPYGLEGRLFHRERIYRSGFLLLPLVTADRPFTSMRGGGLLLEAGRGRVLGARYIESALRSDYREDEYMGLPLFSGGADRFRYLEGRIRGYHGLRVGLSLSEIRSMEYGDAVVLASGVGIELLGVRLDMELARSVEGGLDELSRSRLFELDLDRFEMGEGSALFGEYVAFSAELDGLVYASRSLGTLHLLPGYRFSGRDFVNPAGEIAGPLVESYLTAWWTHPELALLVSFGARDRYDMPSGLEGRFLEGTARMRLRGGFAARGAVLHEVDGDPSLMFSLADENGSYRLVTAARIDGAGNENDFSVLVDGALNLTGSFSVRSTLLLVESAESRYHLAAEFRPSRKFLLNVGFGSFRPMDEEISFQHDELIESPVNGRFVTLSTRVWLGGI